MSEKKEMYLGFVVGNKGRWTFPFEGEASTVKTMQADGVIIVPLESAFNRTDTMKVYAVSVKGISKTWLLSSSLEPEIAQEMQNAGVVVIEENEPKEGVSDYFWKESSPEKVEEKVASKKAKPKGGVTE